jgi:folylpolyglutamate synthase/dihydropteroate synthase
MSAIITQQLKQNERLAQVPADVKLCAQQTVTAAIESALNDAEPEDRIIILGSFYTVAAATRYFS